MTKKYIVTLSAEERKELLSITRQNKVAAQKKLRAQIILACDQGEYGPAQTDAKIVASLPVTTRTVEHLRERVCQDGPMEALTSRPSGRVYVRKLDGKGEARLVALACTPAPAGHSHWTHELLAEELVSLAVVDSICDETVRQTLKKMNSSPILIRTG